MFSKIQFFLVRETFLTLMADNQYDFFTLLLNKIAHSDSYL